MTSPHTSDDQGGYAYNNLAALKPEGFEMQISSQGLLWHCKLLSDEEEYQPECDGFVSTMQISGKGETPIDAANDAIEKLNRSYEI